MFALGSTKYKHYCLFGKYLLSLLEECGGRSIMSLTCGDELNHQEQTFNNWVDNIAKVLTLLINVYLGKQNKIDQT